MLPSVCIALHGTRLPTCVNIFQVDGLRCSKLPLGVRREDFLTTQDMDVEAREEEDDDILLGSDEEEDFTNDYLEDDSELSIEVCTSYANELG